jgi:hypothetical protein
MSRGMVDNAIRWRRKGTRASSHRVGGGRRPWRVVIDMMDLDTFAPSGADQRGEPRLDETSD